MKEKMAIKSNIVKAPTKKTPFQLKTNRVESKTKKTLAILGEKNGTVVQS